jgi:hypothetical protein
MRVCKRLRARARGRIWSMNGSIAATNDGSRRAPRLRLDLNLDTLTNLPEWSAAPRGGDSAVAEGILAAGYEGVQAADAARFRRYGLAAATLARANAPREIEPLARRWAREGYDCGTLHLAWGFEEDDEVDALVRAVITASEEHGIPLYIETHRATITQDPWRTLRMVERNPGVRFNGDFSHWYTGLEMVYGDIERKFDLLQPVFDRVRFIHARAGNGGHIQVPLADPSMAAALEHFREMWTRSMVGFLREARPGDYLIFAPELLEPGINYARRFRGADGTWQEDGDRWEDALALVTVAKECFAEAQRRAGMAPPTA